MRRPTPTPPTAASGRRLLPPRPARPAAARPPHRRRLPAAAAPPDGAAAPPAEATPTDADADAAPVVVVTTLPPPANAAASEGGAGDVSLGALLRFTLPTAAIWVTGPVLGLIDSSVVGLRSSSQLGAMGFGTVVVDYSSYVFTFLAVREREKGRGRVMCFF